MLLKRQLFYAAILALALVAIPSLGVAQEEDFNYEPLLEQVRAELRANKVAVVTQAMALKPADAEKFWPVYRKYEAEVIKLNDARIKMLKNYGDKYDTLTDAQAKEMGEQFLDWEIRRAHLRKKYFNEFTNTIPATAAAKFLQVDYRIDLLIDLQIAAEVPGLFLKNTGSGK
jgi:epoxyqueuosine reductase QueG